MSHLHHKVSALVDGELQGAARERALAHLRVCVPCRHEVEQTVNLKTRLSGLSGAEPTDDLRVRLGALRVADSAGGGLKGSSALRPPAAPRRSARRALVGASSASVAVLALAYAVGGPEPVAAATVTPPVDEFTAEFAQGTGESPLTDSAAASWSLSAASYDQGSAEVARAQPMIAKTPLFGADAPTLRALLTTLTRDQGDDPIAVERLSRAVFAPDRYCFAGKRLLVTVEDGKASSVQVGVRHVAGQGTSFDLSGVSEHASAMFVADDQASGARAFSDGRLALLVSAYDVSLTGMTVVADRAASVVSARRGGELVARMFLDDETGLLVRREVYDGGTLVQVSSFSSLKTSRQGFFAHLPPQLAESTRGTEVTESTARLQDDGYAFPRELTAGFALTAIERVDAESTAVQATYSDGVSSVSVFEQPGVLTDQVIPRFSPVDLAGHSVAVRRGLPTVVLWESAGTVVTVVTDAPEATTARIVASLPHEAPLEDPRARPRLVNGLEKLTDFLRPNG